MVDDRPRGGSSRARRGRSGRRRRHHEPARLHDPLGPRHRAPRRARDRLAGPAHRRNLPRAAGGRHPRGPERVGHEGGLAARRGGSRPHARPVHRDGRHLARAGTSPRARCTSPTPPTRRVTGAACSGDGSDWDDKVLDALRIPEASLPTVVDSSGVIGQATALDGRTADRGAGGRSAVELDRPGRRAARRGQDHLRHRRHARPAPRRAAPAVRAPGRRRLLPDRRVAARRHDHLGRRGRDALRRHERRVAPRRPRHHRHGRREPRRGQPLRDDRRRRLRPGPARARHPPLGLRRPRHAARAHPRQRAAPDRAGRARGRGPAGRRPRRRRRGRHRARRSRPCASTAA